MSTTPSDISNPPGDSPRTSAGEWTFLSLILLVAAAVRLPYRPLKRELGDSLNYSIGAIYTHVAHPPGSIGYCLFLGWVNHLFHNIQFTIIFASFVAALVAIFVCYRVASEMKMGSAVALAAACLYGFSVNTFKASLMGGPHVFEGLCSLLLGFFAWRTIQHRRLTDALLASLVFAISGALRPTTSALLLPLWLFMLWYTVGSTRDFGKLLLHLLIVVPIVAAWTWGNAHYMTLNGYGGQTYQTQVLTSTTYDFANLSATPGSSSEVPVLTFHMPGVELIAWVEMKTGVRLLPHVPNWPTPSLSRALHLMVMQTLKQGWWMVLSLPLAVFIPVVIFLNRKNGLSQRRFLDVFFAVWILPSIAFFIFGHLGTLTYLQVYLGAVCLWSANLFLGRTNAAATSTITPKLRAAVLYGTVVLSIAFFLFARPFEEPGRVRQGLDLVLLQFDAYSIRNGFATSRRVGNFNGDVDPSMMDYVNARTDGQLLQAARDNHFQYMQTPASASNSTR